ncbi:hypothetical protein ANCDUO_22510 [Ancylostoma duodenale]|uniref:Tc3 transposase DNA binding domain-containing protein n=1 Tax=Ancylostoma duodenale TaxID=51022 RepID=A0A0C2FFR8_9BILA|nr:hypothetical protein ANCDUO_22510 [Ancylostoma duodenale]
MPRGSRLSTEEQAKVDVLGRIGFSCRRIASEIGRSANCISNYLKNPTAYNDRKIQCRPRIIFDVTSRQIKQLFFQLQSQLEESKSGARIMYDHLEDYEKFQGDHLTSHEDCTKAHTSSQGCSSTFCAGKHHTKLE